MLSFFPRDPVHDRRQLVERNNTQIQIQIQIPMQIQIPGIHSKINSDSKNLKTSTFYDQNFSTPIPEEYHVFQIWIPKSQFQGFLLDQASPHLIQVCRLFEETGRSRKDHIPLLCQLCNPIQSRFFAFSASHQKLAQHIKYILAHIMPALQGHLKF